MFNGSSSRVTVPDSPSLRLTTAMTLEAWVYPAVNNAAWRDVIYKGNDNYFLEGTSDNGGQARCGHLDDPQSGLRHLGSAGEHLVAHRAHLRQGDTAPVCQWHAGGECCGDANIATSANPLEIGSDSIYGQYFNGRIDEVRIYNRALSATEVQTDMNTPVGGGAPAGDTQAPTAPSGLASSVISSTQINLSWTASTDNVGVTNYLVERCTGAGCSNFAQIGTATGTTYNNTGLTASTSLQLPRARDRCGQQHERLLECRDCEHFGSSGYDGAHRRPATWAPR